MMTSKVSSALAAIALYIMGPNLIVFNSQCSKLFGRGRQGQEERERKIYVLKAGYLDMALHNPTGSLLSVFLKCCCQQSLGLRSLLTQNLCNPTWSTDKSGYKQICKTTQLSRDLPEGAALARSLLSAIPKFL